MSNQSFRTVAIFGGTGTLGYHISEAFLNDGSYKVKVVRKKPENENNKANLLASKGAEIVYADYDQKSELVEALKGIDVLVSVVGTYYINSQFQLLAAAKEAHVKRFIPSEFGYEFNEGEHVFVNDKAKLRKEVEKSGLEYTFIHTGLFYEYIEWCGFDIKNKKATFYVDSDKKIFATSLADVGKYTVESLKIKEARNAHINVAGAVCTFKELLQKFEKASGSKWEVVEDKEVRHRFSNKIDPVPSNEDDFRACILQKELERIDNDKFSFKPYDIDIFIEKLVKKE